VISGPDTLKEAETACQAVVLVLVVAGFLTLAWATYELYSAAYGPPSLLYKIPTDPLEGPAMRIRARRREHAQEVQNRSRKGLLLTLACWDRFDVSSSSSRLVCSREG
jgi:hypothetical protein